MGEDMGYPDWGWIAPVRAFGTLTRRDRRGVASGPPRPAHWRGWLFGALVLVLAGVSSVPPASADHRDESWESTSYYVADADRSRMGLLGCYNSDKQGRMTLFFGSPRDVSGSPGTSMWGAGGRTTDEIGELVRSFVRGYTYCRQSIDYQLLIGVGTSNSAIENRSDDWLVGHGQDWATMVKETSDWVDRHYPGTTRIYGAYDAEPSWSSYGKARQWMDGYEDVADNRPLHANYSADGCSWTSSDNASCNNGWNQQHIWELAWAAPPAMPMPQIYATSGVNAQQWQKVSEYGARHHDQPMAFVGTMTQSGACQQIGGCQGTDNTPHAALDQLLDHLNQSSHTEHGDIASTTDMRWHS